MVGGKGGLHIPFLKITILLSISNTRNCVTKVKPVAHCTLKKS